MATNPYLQQAIDSAQGDVVRNYNLAVQPAYNSAMVRSGSFGNSGVQEMNQNAQQNLQKSLGDISNNMRSQNYQFDQQFDRSLYNDAYGQNMQNLQMATGLLGTQQGYAQGDLTNANNIQNTPLNYWQQFTNGANAIGQGYGNTTVQGGGSSPLVGALGGAQIGSQLSKQYGWGGGTSGGGTFQPGSYGDFSKEAWY